MIEDISTIIIAFSAFVTTGTTIVLVIITRKYVKATEQYARTADEMLRIANTPKVQVGLTSRSQSYNVWTIDFCVQNIGTGFAYDIKFLGDLPSLYPQVSDEPLSEYPIIKNGISFLGPGKRYQIPIIWGSLESGSPETTGKRSFDVGVTYRDSTGTELKEKFRIDFTQYEGYTQMDDPSIDNIARSLQHIAQTLWEIKKGPDNQNQ